MKRKRDGDEQIAFALRQAVLGQDLKQSCAAGLEGVFLG